VHAANHALSSESVRVHLSAWRLRSSCLECLYCAADKKVEDIKPPPPGAVGEGDNLVVRVHSSNLVVNKTRVDGTPVKIAEVVVGDETGCITFRARNGADAIHVQQLVLTHAAHRANRCT
jgi:hypothetical protein